MLGTYVKVSFLMMRAKPVRAVLSLLGIFIGVMALVLILAIREGLRAQIDNTYRTQGANIIFIQPGYSQETMQLGKLTPDNVTELSQTRGIITALPRLMTAMTIHTPAGTTSAHTVGIDEGFLSTFRVPMIRGRGFLKSEIETKQPVCLLTADMAQKLFPSTEPIGSYLDVEGAMFQIIGVVDWGESVPQRTNIPEVDLLVPLTWLSSEPGGDSLSMIEVRVSPEISIDQGIRLVKSAMTHHIPQRESLYFFRSMEEFVKRSQDVADHILKGLMAIAGISLLVGGIGIANVMVTTVTERTREIGLRKALGARRQDILFQFLVEASLMSGTGGVLAVLVGWAGLSIARSIVHIAFPVAITPGSMGGCVLLTLAIGMIAGVYPASRAASLSPAEALRYE